MDSVASAVNQKTDEIRRLYIASCQAEWNAAIKGTQENLEKAAQTRVDFMKFFADPAAFEQFRKWDHNGTAAADTRLDCAGSSGFGAAAGAALGGGNSY